MRVGEEMLLRWIAVFMLAGALVVPVYAAEKDAPLPFDDPSAAPQIVKKKKPSVKSRKQAKAKVGKKSNSSHIAQKPANKKPPSPKPATRKKR